MTHLLGVKQPLHKFFGLVLGPIIFTAMLLFDANQNFMASAAWRTSAVGLWMAIWWATEATDVAITALLPIVTFDLLGVSSIKEAAAPYAHPIIYLFLGAFILAMAVQRWNLHQRIALIILSRTGTDAAYLIGGFMVVAALLSMWMTNTSTTMMLIPIALSVAAVIQTNVPGVSKQQGRDFEIALLLGLAFSATIGGMATLIGTPPNALLAAFLEENYSIQVGFFDWMKLGVPITIVMLPICWIILTRWVYTVKIPSSEEALDHLLAMKSDLGPITLAEKRVAMVFLLVVLGWVFRGSLANWFSIEGISDTSIAVMGAIALFLLPSGNTHQTKLLIWSDLRSLPWGVLILFGGGLSLASAISSSGLAQWLGEGLAPLAALGVVMMIFGATALVVFLTEMTSNLATTATFLPVIGAMAIESGIDPMLLCVPVTLGASCAFMLPVATAPNAIVFSSGKITIPQMVRVGFLINGFGILIITAASFWWAPSVFD